jgi:hypothetical protein
MLLFASRSVQLAAAFRLCNVSESEKLLPTAAISPDLPEEIA